MERFIHEEIRVGEELPVFFNVYRDSRRLITSHWHNSMEVVCVCEGRLDVTVNGRTRSLLEGDFAIINSADIHSTWYGDNSLIILLQIPFSFLTAAIPDYGRLRFECNAREGNDRVRAILYSMKDVYEKKPEGFSLRFLSLLYDFLFSIMQYYKTVVDTSAKIRTDRNLRRLKAVTDYVKENCHACIPLKEAAAVISLNPEYFCRFFKKYMGLTFQEYVNRIRLARVYEDLVHTDLSVTEILARNGCTGYRLFMRNFKSTYGCTPMQMRRSVKAPPRQT